MQVNPGNTVRRHTHNKRGEKKTSLYFTESERNIRPSLVGSDWELKRNSEGCPWESQAERRPLGGTEGEKTKMAAATRRGSSLCCCLWSRVDREAPSDWNAPYSFLLFYVTVFFKKICKWIWGPIFLAHCLFRNENRTRRQKKKEMSAAAAAAHLTHSITFLRERMESCYHYHRCVMARNKRFFKKRRTRDHRQRWGFNHADHPQKYEEKKRAIHHQEKYEIEKKRGFEYFN